MIRVKEASTMLNKKESNFYISYSLLNKFVVKIDNVVYFDINKYYKYIELKNRMTEITTLFIEYLVNEIGLSYHKLSKISNTSYEALIKHRVGVNFCKKFISFFKDREEFKKFNEFYEFSKNYRLDYILEEFEKLEKELK